MKPETLEMYIKLQPLFKEKMGDDIYYVKCLGSHNINKINDCKYLCVNTIDCKHRIITPLPIDPKDNERKERGEKPRGLWGMVDWNKNPLAHLLSGSVEIDALGRIYLGNGVWRDPTTALLKVLMKQEAYEKE